jgi:hypothetical protein
MTDEPQGLGWWQASDLKWYPPERHPTYEAPPPPPPGRPPVPQPRPADYPPQPQHVGAQPSEPPSYGQPSEGIAVTTHGLGKGGKQLKIFIDGDEMAAVGWGRTVVPARPGRHHVHVHVPRPWFSWPEPRRMGPADTVVEVYPGRLAELEYKKPVWQYSPGSLGAAPQSYNGVGIAITVNLLSAAFFSIMAFMYIMTSAHVVAGPLWGCAFFVVVGVLSAVLVLVKSGSEPKTGQPPSQQAAAAPGWYPDPSHANLTRYFDGRDWTSATAPRG